MKSLSLDFGFKLVFNLEASSPYHVVTSNTNIIWNQSRSNTSYLIRVAIRLKYSVENTKFTTAKRNSIGGVRHK